MEKLFGAYSQVDIKKNHDKEGTGLGLAISKQFVEMMGGTIEVKSTYGEGSEFYFTISQEIVDARKAVEVKEEPGQNTENVLNFTAPTATIMVVDDNEMKRKVALGLLAPLKMQMDTAENGKKALDMICKKKYDLIFMDHMMPVVDGKQVLKMMRTEAEFSTIPVIFLTGKSDKESVMKVMGLKPEGYLLKTMPPEEIVKTIDEFFLKRKGMEK